MNFISRARAPHSLRTGAALTLLLWVLGACGGGQAPESRLGHLEFPNSGAAAAQPAFLEGVLLLHSFEYDDARERFREAQSQDPGFALAYWGEAMTYEHPIWNRQETEPARDALRRFGTNSAHLTRSMSESELGYFSAAETLFGEGPIDERRRAYAEAMARLSASHPDDLEAAAFHTLALLGSTAGERDFSVRMQAAAIAREVLQRNPKHPGAAHYLIHCYDDPIHAPLGLEAAKAYVEIAPAAPHAQHMPAHIFVALGMWKEVVASNIASWEASEERVKRKKLEVDDRGFHALWWLEYGYLQLGEMDKAREQLAIIEQDAARSGSPRTRSYLAYMRASFLVDSERWEEPIQRPDRYDLTPRAAAVSLFADGMWAIEKGKPHFAEKALEKMGHLSARDERGRSRELAVAAMVKQLEAALARAQGRGLEAFALIAEAAELEDSMSLTSGPPVPPKPVHELWGEWLLEDGLKAEAAEQFELALKRAPGRRLSVAGLKRTQSPS